MTHETPPHPDDEQTTVHRWPQLADDDADETRTRWVAAGPAPSTTGQPPETPGWFTPGTSSSAPADERGWDPRDAPYDQNADAADRASASPQTHAPGSESGEAVSSYDVPVDPAGRLRVVRIAAQIACPLILLVGLSLTGHHQRSGWDAYPAWAFFALGCAVLQLAPIARRTLRLADEHAWFLAAVGTAGLVGFWVVIVLPVVSSNAGFAQTIATACAVIGLWLSPGRRM